MGTGIEIPPECQPAAEAVEQARADVAAAHQEMTLARSTAERRDAARTAAAAYARLQRARSELDSCRGCPDPVDELFEDIGGSLALITGSRIASGSPSITNVLGGSGGALGFTLAGCEHELARPNTGMSTIWNPFPLSTFTLPRRFPDVFTLAFPPAMSTAPYAVSISSVGTIGVEVGRFDRSSGHLDVWCAASIGWLHFGDPPAWLHWLYGLDFGPSTYRGLFTTRTVESAVPPVGATMTGRPLDRTNGILTLVSSGALAGGFGNGERVSFTLTGVLSGPRP